MIGFIDLNNYSPYPKNPKMASFFKEIGLADELGSGIKKIAKYSSIYSNGAQPTFRDDETFIASIPLCNEINNNDISYVEFKIEGKEEKYYFYKN